MKEIDGNRVTVKNSFGNLLYVSKDILQGMYSADHYKKEVNMTVSSLAELLQGVQDHVFTVTFRKQQSEADAAAILTNADKSMYTEKERSKSAKEVIAGKLTTMVCHMLEVENNLGRSLVIDLSCGGPNKFRQVDHRSIESIIF